MSLTKESVVVITGAGSGIGRALALRLAKEDIAGIAISDVFEEGLRETEDLLKNAKIKITTHKVDVADEEAMRQFVQEVAAEHKRVSHVINNAGVALGGQVKDVSINDMRWLMDINFWGVVYGTRFFMPYLEKEKSAHIVNFSSLFGIIAPPGNATYCASKFAVRGFSESLRHELEDTNITVSVVHPGGIATNIANRAKLGEHANLTAEEIKQRKAKANEALNRTTPEQAAEIIVQGIKSKNERILIGFDAKLLSWISRIFPRKYFAVIDKISGGKLRNE